MNGRENPLFVMSTIQSYIMMLVRMELLLQYIYNHSKIRTLPKEKHSVRNTARNTEWNAECSHTDEKAACYRMVRQLSNQETFSLDIASL